MLRDGADGRFWFPGCRSDRDLGHAVKQLKSALEKNRVTIREKTATIKALEERLAAVTNGKSSAADAAGVGMTRTPVSS